MIGHSDVLLSKCAQFREEGLFTDVQLQIGKTIFSAHRMVLAAYSDYFYAMFTNGMKESTQEVIELKDESIFSDVLKIVMDSIYTGDLLVNEENVFEVLAAADHLQVISVVQQCCEYLLTKFVELRFDVETFCRIWTTANRHGLKDLQEAAEHKMTSMFRDVCESEEFLSHISADQLFALVSRDDLSAPSETFVFKSVMQWIKHKKEERMAVAAKALGAVRLGQVDIRVVVEELNTEEMQQVSEIHMHLHESLIHNCMPSNSSKFALEKAKPRSMSPVLVAIRPQDQMQYFDVETKMWKSLAFTTPQVTIEAKKFLHTKLVGNKLFVGGKDASPSHYLRHIYCYDTEKNVWENVPHSLGKIGDLCTVGDYMYAISPYIEYSSVPRRYSFAKRRWQSYAELRIPRSDKYCICFYNSGATVLNSKVYVLYGSKSRPNSYWCMMPAVLLYFDPVKNKWEQKASTCQPHFFSTLFVVKGRIYVAGGYTAIDHRSGGPYGSHAPVEVYDEENNSWSVVTQKHIPPNNLGAVEVEGRVYFIINKFPIDSGIRIPPEEVYHVDLEDWDNLAKVHETAVLCYLPVKRDSLKAAE
ncbi:hypothetical protein ACROYT_G024220 [Oculina patagonica]